MHNTLVLSSERRTSHIALPPAMCRYHVTMQNSAFALQELEGAEQVLEHAGTEIEQAGRFMLVRDPPIVVDPVDAEARVTEEGPLPPLPALSCTASSEPCRTLTVQADTGGKGLN